MDNTLEALSLDLACQAIGVIFFPLAADTLPAQIGTFSSMAGAKTFVFNDSFSWTRARDDPGFDGEMAERVILIDAHSHVGHDDRVVPLSELKRSGSCGASDLVPLTEFAQRRSSTEVVCIHRTSGITRPPAMVPLSVTDLMAAWREFFESWGPSERDRFVVEGSFANVASHAMVLMLPLLYGCVPHFPEHPGAVEESMVEVAPTLSLALPATWQARASDVEDRMQQGSKVNRWAYRRARSTMTGERAALGSNSGDSWRSLPSLSAIRAIVAKPILRQKGLHKLRVAAVGGSYVRRSLVQYWRIMGVPVREFYGLAEASGLVAFQEDAHDSVLKIRSSLRAELKDGEIWIIGAGAKPLQAVCQSDVAGRSQPPASEEWLRTGDIGSLASGSEVSVAHRHSHVVRLERTNNVGNLTTVRINVADLERRLDDNPLIKHVAVVGNGRPHLVALVELDVGAVSLWARGNSVHYGSLESLALDQRVQELVAATIDREVGEVSSVDSESMPPASFLVLPLGRGFREAGVLAPTGEIIRYRIEEEFEGELDGLYTQAEPEADDHKTS
jgi:long-chain acyl-CoA synthetase